MLFSATMPEEVMRFADALAPDAVFVQVGSRRGPAQTISHEARVLPAREKVEFPVANTCGARRRRRSSSSTRRSAPTGWHASCIASGLRAAAIHADRSQKDRTAAIESFRTGRTKILVATDVAARGLDIDDVGADRQLRSPARARLLRPSRRPHGPLRRDGPRADARRSLRAPRSRGAGEGVRTEPAGRVIMKAVKMMKGMKGRRGSAVDPRPGA